MSLEFQSLKTNHIENPICFVFGSKRNENLILFGHNINPFGNFYGPSSLTPVWRILGF